jgi:hypothetical protein
MATFDVIIKYNLSTAHHHDDVNTYVKKCMLEKGYNDHFKYKEEIYNLPNTTLWKKGVTDIEAGYNDLKKCVEEYNNSQRPRTYHEVERFIANEFNGNWHAIKGKPHQ